MSLVATTLDSTDKEHEPNHKIDLFKILHCN